MALRRKLVTIELDGAPRLLRYDLNALCAFEEQTGVSITDALKSQSMKAIRALLWAGMLHDRPELTIAEVGRMEFGTLQQIVTQVMTALTSDATTENEPDRPTAAVIESATGGAPIGPNSGLTGASISALTIPSSGN